MSATAAIAGLGVGAAFGAVAARGAFCMRSAVADAVLRRDGALLRALGIAVGVQLLLLPLAIALGTAVAAPHLTLVANAAGGLAFGGGMALAGGCASSLLWRTGAGSGAALVAVAGFAAGELAARRGPLDGLPRALDDAGPAPRAETIQGLLHLPYATVAVVVGALLVVAARRRATPRAVATGVALGVVGVAAWIAATLVGYRYGLGFVGTAANVDAAVRARDASVLSMEPFLALGTVAGAAAALRARPRLPGARRAARALAGGVVMGVAGTVAHGCNVGHALTGVPLLSVGSLLATAAMAAGVLLPGLVRGRVGTGGRR